MSSRLPFRGAPAQDLPPDYINMSELETQFTSSLQQALQEFKPSSVDVYRSQETEQMRIKMKQHFDSQNQEIE